MAPYIETFEPPGDVDSEPVRIWNKCDLTADGAVPAHYRISAKTGKGLLELLEGLSERVRKICGEGEAGVIARSRHQQAIATAISALETVCGTKSMQIELIAENLREASDALGRITGRIDVEDLLDSIFREFCIGK